MGKRKEIRSPWFRHPWNQEWNGLLHHALIKCRCPFFSKWECPDSGWTYVFVTMESPYYLYIKHFWLSFQLQTLTAKRWTCHTIVTLTVLQLYISFTTALWILSRIEQKRIKWRLDMKSVYNWSNYPCHSLYNFFFYRKEDWYTWLRDGINNSIVHCYSSLRFKWVMHHGTNYATSSRS